MIDFKARIIILVSAIVASVILGLSLIFITGGNLPLNNMALVIAAAGGQPAFFVAVVIFFVFSLFRSSFY